MELLFGVVRALLWILYSMVSGLVITAVMIVGYPVMKLIDPKLYWYQRLLCFSADVGLHLFSRITVKVSCP